MVVYEIGFLTSDIIKEGKKNYSNYLDSFTVDWGMPKNDNTPKN